MKKYNGLKIEVIRSEKIDVILISDNGVFISDDFEERGFGSNTEA